MHTDTLEKEILPYRSLWIAVLRQSLNDLACVTNSDTGGCVVARAEAIHFLYGRGKMFLFTIEASDIPYGGFAAVMNMMLEKAKEVLEIWLQEGRGREPTKWSRAAAKKELARLGMQIKDIPGFVSLSAMTVNLAQAMLETGRIPRPLPCPDFSKLSSIARLMNRKGRDRRGRPSASRASPRSASRP